MKLSAYIVADWLADSVLLSEIDKGECVFTSVSLSDLDSGLAPDCIYVVSPRECDKLGDQIAVQVRLGADSLYVDSTDSFSVYQSIMDAFLFYNHWECELKDAVIKKESFQKITEIAYLAFRCSIIAFDWRGVILGSMPKNDDEEIGHLIDPSLFKKIQEGEICKRVAQNIIPSGFVDTPVKASVISLNVYFPDNSFVLFYFSSDVPGKNMGHMQLALFMRSVISYLKPLSRNQEMQPLYHEFVTILSGEEPDQDKLNEVQNFKGWKLDDEYLLYYFEPHSEFSLKRNGITFALSEKIPAGIVFAYEKHPLLCLPLREQKHSEEMLISILPFFDFSAAASLPFHEWSELPSALAQARTAISISENQSGRLYYCNDYAWQYIFQRIQEQCLKINFISPDAKLLDDYDKAHGTELLKTLNVFLRSQSNITLSAELLYIHRNSMKYRIKQIESLITSDLKCHEDRQILLFSSEILLRKNVP